MGKGHCPGLRGIGKMVEVARYTNSNLHDIAILFFFSSFSSFFVSISADAKISRVSFFDRDNRAE